MSTIFVKGYCSYSTELYEGLLKGEIKGAEERAAPEDGPV
jgi:hypothetical protein